MRRNPKPQERKEVPARLQEEERQTLHQLVRRSLARNAEAGKLNGLAPLGYVNRRQGDRTWIEIDPQTARLIQKAFRLALFGESLQYIAWLLDKKGLQSRHGRPLSTAALYRILTNPFYAGDITFAGEIANAVSSYPGQHWPLVPRFVFAAVQRRFASQSSADVSSSAVVTNEDEAAPN